MIENRYVKIVEDGPEFANFMLQFIDDPEGWVPETNEEFLLAGVRGYLFGQVVIARRQITK